MVNTSYYYTFFYETFEEEDVLKRGLSVEIKTLNYQDGMHQLFLELIDYAKSKSNALEFAIGTTHLNFFYDQPDNSEKTLKQPLMNEIDAIFLFEHQFSKNQQHQSPSIKQANNELLNNLKATTKMFGIDYLNSSSPLLNDMVPVDGVIGFIDPVDESKLFGSQTLDNIPLNDPDRDVTSINDVQNFALYDGSFYLDELEISTIQGSSYDLIILPVSKNSYTSELSPWSFQEITSLKEKSDGINRLVYAMIDVSKIWENGPFWNVEWTNIPEFKPDWVDIGINKTSDDNSRIEAHQNDYYVKYWRTPWKDYMKQLVDNVINTGVDGIVFTGAEMFNDYNCKVESAPNPCE